MLNTEPQLLCCCKKSTQHFPEQRLQSHLFFIWGQSQPACSSHRIECYVHWRHKKKRQHERVVKFVGIFYPNMKILEYIALTTGGICTVCPNNIM